MLSVCVRVYSVFCMLRSYMLLSIHVRHFDYENKINGQQLYQCQTNQATPNHWTQQMTIS